MRDTSEVNTNTEEGKLLLCAISLLTTVSKDMTPNDVLRELSLTSEMVLGDEWCRTIN